MNKIFISVIGVIIGVAGWLTILNNNAPKEIADQAQLQKALYFELRDYNDKIVKLSDFANKPLVINSWAVWCPFCVDEIPDFVRAQEEFGEKVKIILINRAESLDVAKKFSDEVGVSKQLLLLLDPSDSFYRAIGGFSMPETIFVDVDGNIVIHKRGPMRLPEIREKINQII